MESTKPQPIVNNTIKKMLDPTIPFIIKYKDFILEGCEKHGLSPFLICAIGSRESCWTTCLTPKNVPDGTGDFIKRSPNKYRTGTLPSDFGGFGRGIMQIDYDAHEFARGQDWKDPRKNILYGCSVLYSNRALLTKYLPANSNELYRAYVAAYNCGAGNVIKALNNKKDVDYYTHGRDYSADVLNRMQVYTTFYSKELDFKNG